MGLFDSKNTEAMPLAERLRPDSFNNFVGQDQILSKGKALRTAIDNDEIFSMIFWGPPGCGKTTLAQIIANKTNAYFEFISATTSGLPEVKKQIQIAVERQNLNKKKTIIFIDEIHRFNKTQQSALLSDVERGTIILIGTTTENPSYEIITPLLSRVKVFVFHPLSKKDLKIIIERAIKKKEKMSDSGKIEMESQALDFLVDSSMGDARIALNTLEIALSQANRFSQRILVIKTNDIAEALQRKNAKYDKGGDEHYQIISALIKTIRGSDPDAALYWLARMLQAGEDPKYIARRLVILASEDIGNADPQAIIMASAVFSAVGKIGMPEADLILAQAVIYLATAKKSNTCYTALRKAQKDAYDYPNLPVPFHLRNATTKLMKELGYGIGYKYSHDYDSENGKQPYFPEELKNRKYYHKG